MAMNSIIRRIITGKPEAQVSRPEARISPSDQAATTTGAKQVNSARTAQERLAQYESDAIERIQASLEYLSEIANDPNPDPVILEQALEGTKAIHAKLTE